jgi:hypothetical protein
VIAYLDANIVIYVVEHHPFWEPKAQARIAQLRAGGGTIAVSDIHRLECLVGPFICDRLRFGRTKIAQSARIASGIRDVPLTLPRPRATA